MFVNVCFVVSNVIEPPSSRADLLSRGHGRLMRRLITQNDVKVVIENEEDLHAVLTSYDLLVAYIKLRTRFHSGSVGAALIVNLLAAVAFLVTTTFKDLNIPTMVQVALFWISFVYALTLATILIPLIRTSQLLHNVFLHFLTEHRLMLQSETARGSNGTVIKGEHLESFRSQVPALESKILQLQVCPSTLRVLGIEATAASLGKFLAAVIGSLLSGLMKQAAEENQ